MILTEYEVTDRGALDRLTPQEAFERGLEWMAFAILLSQGRWFSMRAHLDSANRLVALAEAHGFTVDRAPIDDAWALLTVG